MSSFKVNRHSVEIAADKARIFKELVLWGQASWWPKDANMKFVNLSGVAVQEGTEYLMKIVPSGASWHARVTKIEPDYSIRRDFLDGMFNGFETVSIKDKGNNFFEVAYEMFYQINGSLNKLLWPIAFEKLHNANIRMILNSLKQHLEQK
jgi:hypothetical protein